MSQSNSYRTRRIYSAVRGGFKRIGVTPRPSTVASLKVSFGRIWDRGIGKPCPLLCSRKLTPRLAAFCHNHALSQGGKHVASNVFLACGRCNRAQRTLLKAQYLELQKLVLAHFGQEIWTKIRAWLAGSRY